MCVVLGFIGALFGSWLAGLIGLPEPFMLQISGKDFPVLWSIIGAALFVAILNLLTPTAATANVDLRTE